MITLASVMYPKLSSCTSVLKKKKEAEKQFHRYCM